MQYDVEYIRNQFPALKVTVNGHPAAYFDGPGGTQVPERVIEAMVSYLSNCNANAGGYFKTSRESDQIIAGARCALADFLGSEADEIAFGQNTTTLIYQLALALGRFPGRRNEIIITEIDHEANRGPWQALEEKGFIIREARFDPESCTLDLEDFKAKLSENTLVAAFNYASNAVGTISDVGEMARLTKEAGAISVVDAVHYALHGPIDVKAIGVDYLICSAYKFFGPHIGVLYGKREPFSALPSYRLQVQLDAVPHRIETGTLNHEGIAGAAEAVEFIADIGDRFGAINCVSNPGGHNCPDRREKILAGMQVLEKYEQPLADKLLKHLAAIKGVRVYAPPAGQPRTSTVSFTVEGVSPDRVTEILGEKGIFAWNGHFYALRLVERLGLADKGGLIRIGLSPYNTEAEIDRLLFEIEAVAGN